MRPTAPLRCKFGVFVATFLRFRCYARNVFPHRARRRVLVQYTSNSMCTPRQDRPFSCRADEPRKSSGHTTGQGWSGVPCGAGLRPRHDCTTLTPPGEWPHHRPSKHTLAAYVVTWAASVSHEVPCAEVPHGCKASLRKKTICRMKLLGRSLQRVMVGNQQPSPLLLYPDPGKASVTRNSLAFVFPNHC